MSAQKAAVIDYRKANAANLLLPKPSILSSSGWSNLHLEVFQQPKFEIAEHQHTMHVIACGLPNSPEESERDSKIASGERWLDGKLERERRRLGDIAIVPAGISHRCNWNTSVQFMVLAIEPALLQQVGMDFVNPDRIELMPQFMSQSDALIQGREVSMTYTNTTIEQTEVFIPTPDGQMPAFLFTQPDVGQKPAVLLLMEAFGLTPHIQDVATRIANEGYVVLTPDLYYRELPDNKFGYDEVEQAMAMMWRLDFGKPVEEDIRAALTYLKSRSDVYPDRIGVTGFCLGGGLTFLTACKLSAEIAAVAPFYGMVLDEWIESVKDIAVPVYLFFGGADPFISRDRIQQIKSRFQELGKDYNVKTYLDASHGFFCHERSNYDRLAAEDAWRELIQFFQQHLLSINDAGKP